MKKFLNEEQKPQLIVDLEKSFGNLLYNEKDPYEPSESDLELMFNIINYNLFHGKLPAIDKYILKAGQITDPRFKGVDTALAGFSHGFRNGMETNIFIVKHSKRKSNFFTIICSLMHEMIHMYDYYHGPLRAQLTKYAAIGNYDLNYPDAITGERVPPDPAFDTIRGAINLKNILVRGLDPRQVPDEIRTVIKRPELDRHPRQYAFPAEIGHSRDSRTGKAFEYPQPLLKKYTMHMIDGFYDVHGSFFQQVANTANQMGFVIEDIFTQYTPTKMQKMYENNEIDPAAILLKFFKTDDYKDVEIRDLKNWFFCIS